MKKTKKRIMLYVSMIVMVASFLCFGIVSFADESDDVTRKPKELDVKYLNENYVTNYKFGNDVKEILYNGGMNIELGNEAKIFSENGKIIDHYKDKILFFSRDKELILVENENPKNLNVLDETGNALDDTIYYTTDGKVKSVNVKNKIIMEVAPLAKYNVEMMYLVNNKELFCLSEGKVIKFNVETMAVEEVEQCSEANMFIPTEYGIIFMQKNNDTNEITVKGTNIKSYIDEIQGSQSYKNYELHNIDKDNIYIQIVVPETEYEYEKILRYKANINDLFNNLSVNIFKEDYNSDYDGIYNGNIDKIEISSYAGGYKLGNYLNNFFEGGVKLKLNNKSKLVSKDNKIYISENNKEYILAKEKDVKNMCVVDNGEKYLYYTSKNIIKRLNLTTFRKEYVESLKDVKANKMCSVDDNYLYYISDGNICVYDIKNNKTEVKESANGISNYIPTSFGIIKLVNSGEEINIIANGNNVKESFNGLYKEELYEKFSYAGIDNESLYIQINLLETDLELEKTLKYKIEVKQLFSNMSASSFEECYNSEYDNLDRNLDLNFSESNFVGECKLGTSMENFFEGGETLQLSNDGQLVSKDNTIAYVDENHDNSLIAKEKEVANMCFMQNGNTGYVYYTVKGVVKRLNLFSYRKEYVDKLQDIRVDKMCSVDDHMLYYVSDNIIYSFDVNNGNINQIDQIEEYDKFLPSQYGLIWFGNVEGFDDFESIIVNNKCISQYFNELDELVDKEYSVEKYRFSREYLYIDFDLEGEEISYWISINDLFNGLSVDKFKYVDKDELYNYLDNNGRISMTYVSKGQKGGLYYLGNNCENILEGGQDLLLEDGSNIKVEEDKIVYENEQESIVLTEGCRDAKNLNIKEEEWPNKEGKVYYSARNKIKSIDIYSGNVTTELCLSKSEIIDMMYVVGNEEIWFSVKDTIYIYNIKEGRKEEYIEEEGLHEFIPSEKTIVKVEIEENSEKYDLIVGGNSMCRLICNQGSSIEELSELQGYIEVTEYNVEGDYLFFTIKDQNSNEFKFKKDLNSGGIGDIDEYLLYSDNLEAWIVNNWNDKLRDEIGFDNLEYDSRNKIQEEIISKNSGDEDAINTINVGNNIRISNIDNNIIITYLDGEDEVSYSIYKCKDENSEIDGITYDYDNRCIRVFEKNICKEIRLSNYMNIDEYNLLDSWKKASKSSEEDTFTISNVFNSFDGELLVEIEDEWFILDSHNFELIENEEGTISKFIPIDYRYVACLYDDEDENLSKICICNLETKKVDSTDYYMKLKEEVLKKEIYGPDEKKDVIIKFKNIIYDSEARVVLEWIDFNDESRSGMIKLTLYNIKDYIDYSTYYE